MVSIIVPCYNGEKFIYRCFNSILNQTYKNIQLIIVNDGSIDNSENIILKYKNKFLNLGFKFKYIYKVNGGPSSAVNVGLKYVKGRYLTLIDVDDYIMPQSIELKVNYLDENIDYNIVRTNGYYVNENDLYNESKLFVTKQEEKGNIHVFDTLIQAKTNNWAGSYMVRTDKLFNFYKDRNIYESKYGQNLQILLPLAYNGKCGFIDIPLMKYIKQNQSLSQLKGNIDKEIINMNGYKDIREYMVNLIVHKDEIMKYKRLIDITYARYFMELAYYKSKKLLMKENYKILISYDSCGIEDKILYYGLENKFIWYILRVYKKLKNWGNK
ncbi:glycosyltransferase family A protein [Terrisporobacter petrolearius]|uniref:glycosyltransferase family A protein n=1 Tax=Terrisporobacter petrolearius TaxID=1460447 RepID=UPI003B00BB17